MMALMTPDVLRLVEALMADLDCPRSLTVLLMVRHGEWDQMTELKVNPRDYLDSETYWRACMASDFLRKCVDIPTTRDLDSVTLKKWWDAERKCFETNTRFQELSEDWGPLNGDPFLERVDAILASVRKNLEWLIGYGPSSSCEGTFGPGATVSDRSGCTTVPDKLSSKPTLTRGALFHLVPWTGTLWASASADLGHDPFVVRGNAYFTVYKDSTTHRPCAKEPSINAYYQRSLGIDLADKLRCRGIDTRDGQRVHKLVACRGSLTQDVVTIDLVSASDTVAYAPVMRVLPKGWASALNDLRSPLTLVEGKWVHLEKFSSMGNGYTFELETALFTAICMTASGLVPSARAGRTLLVFGDDIIVSKEHGESVLNLLKFFGFTANERKTFMEGNFRESCGGDFFLGVPVRAHYLEKYPTSPDEWISLANGLRRACSGRTDRLARVLRSWHRAIDQIPRIARCYGPVALGDIVIHDDESKWDTKLKDCIRSVRCWAPTKFKKIRWNGFAYSVQLAAALKMKFPGIDQVGVSPHENERFIIPRDGVLGYSIKWVPFS